MVDKKRKICLFEYVRDAAKMSRYYNPQWGRFLNADIPEIAQQCKNEINGLNPFAYCCNDPVNNSDPTGYRKITLKKGWKYRIDKKSNEAKEHIKIWKGKKTYSQNKDGSPHDKNNNTKGDPPRHVRDDLKESGEWDWDGNKERYYKSIKNNPIPVFNFGYSYEDIGFVIGYALLLSILIVFGAAIIFIPVYV